MDKGLRDYVAIGAALVIVTGILLAAASSVSVAVLNGVNDRYMQLYKDGERGVSSPWYQNGFHIVDEGFIDELEEMKKWDKNIVAIGSSLSVISFQPSITKPDEGYEYRFLVCGNGCWKSDKQLYNLYRASGAEHEDDIVKLEVSFSTFRSMEMSITESVVAKWRAYSVEQDCSVERTSPLLAPVSSMNLALLRFQNIWELGTDCVVQYTDNLRTGQDNMIIPGNFRNNYFNYETVASGCRMTKRMKKDMLELINEIRSSHDLVVELSPLPKGLANTAYGRELNKYIDKELIPILDRNSIRYFDYRRDYEDREFCDGVHLGYDAGVKYTKKLTEDMNQVIGALGAGAR